jgi:hypothetical protein
MRPEKRAATNDGNGSSGSFLLLVRAISDDENP